jgi:uncharacterized protein (DUF1778 family)
MRDGFIPQGKQMYQLNIRFPKDIVSGIKKAINNKNISFTTFVVNACRAALESLEE